MTKVFLGVDIGTSATKTLAVDESGRILAAASADYPIHFPKPGWSEQNPEDWWQATVTTIKSVIKQAKLDKSNIKGIGLSGQMHGSVFLDRQNNVIRPALLWNDQRTARECEEIEKLAGGRAELLKLVGNPALTGFTAPKILWLRNHEPKNYKATKQILLPKDYVRHCLTGAFATEVSDASGTLLLNVADRNWSQPLLDRLAIDRDLLPTCYESQVVSGTVSALAAKATGLAVGTPVVGGGGDQAAGAVGNGIVNTGVISATLGTSGVVFAHADQCQIDPHGRLHTFCHAVPGKWHQMGVVLSAGGSLQWFRNTWCAAEIAAAKKAKIDPYELISELASQSPAGCEGLVFLPYLTGERTPHADPNARGAFVGISHRHGRSHFARAIMEGVGYAMRDSLDLIRQLKVPIKQIRVSGGGGRSPFWRQVLADIFAAEVVTINAKEGPAFGVALLAAVGTGAYKSVESACKATIAVVDQSTSNKKATKIYDQYYELYCNLYPALRQHFSNTAQLLT